MLFRFQVRVVKTWAGRLDRDLSRLHADVKIQFSYHCFLVRYWQVVQEKEEIRCLIFGCRLLYALPKVLGLEQGPVIWVLS